MSNRRDVIKLQYAIEVVQICAAQSASRAGHEYSLSVKCRCVERSLNELLRDNRADMTPSSRSIGRVVLFNGPPSSGKTSLVEALQRAIPAPWFHLSLDDFRLGFSDHWWTERDGRLFDRVLSGYLGSLRAMALAGNDVLAEAVITPQRRLLYRNTFDEMPINIIGVTCPLAMAIQRERARTDRRNGPVELPADEYAAVHLGLHYDFEVDTSLGAPEELAGQTIPQFQDLHPSNFNSHLSID